MKRPKVRIRRPRVRIRWRKNSSWWAVGVAVAFFVSLFAFHIVLMRHAESIVRNILDNRVRQATEGLYSSAFEHIELDYTSRDLIIHNLRLYPDSARLQDARGNTTRLSSAFDILIPELRIEGISLRKAYLDKDLIVRQLRIEAPRINVFLDFDQTSLIADTLLKRDINQRLAPFFKTIRAKKIIIEEAQLDLRTIKKGQHSRIKSTLAFEAWNLTVKTAAAPQDTNWLEVGRFLLQAGPAVGYIADNTYQLRLRSISASSADSSFYLQGFHLIPTADIQTLLSRKPELDRIYTIHVPQLFSYGLNFEALYNQRNFEASEITLLSPTLELYDAKPRQEGEKENFKPEDLYPAIEKVLNQLVVEKLNIRYGRAIVRNQEERALTNLQVSIRSAAVHNFKLDSAARFQEDKLFYSDSIQVHLSNYQLRLSDNLHLLQADELLVNSNTSRIKAVNLRLRPDTLSALQQQSPALYEVHVPQLTLAGIDLLDLYNNNQLLIDSLQVKAPTIEYSRQALREKTKPADQQGFRQEDVYGLISDYLYVLNINQLAIDSGKVSLHRNISDSVEVFTTLVEHAYLWNLLIDSTSAYRMNKLFYADDFDIRIMNYRHQLPDGIHLVEARNIDISTLQDRILLTGVRIRNQPGYQYPFPQVQRQQIPTLLNIEVPYLALNGVDILNAYLSKRLEVAEVLMPNPKVHIASGIGKKKASQREIISSRALYDLISDFTESVSVANLRLTEAEILTAFYAPNGLLQLNSSNASVSIDNFRFDAYTSQNPKRLFFADAVTVRAQNFLADLPDVRYQIRAQELLASTATNTIVAEEVSLEQPDELLNEQDLLLQGKKGVLGFTLPRVRLTGVDFDQAYYQEHLAIDSIIAESPQLTYYQLERSNRGNKRRNRTILPQTSLYQSLSPYLAHLSVGTVLLEEGTIRTTSRRRGELRQNLFLDKISIAVNNFLVDSAAAQNSQRFFYSEDIRVHIGQYRWLLPDKEHQITAGNLHLSTLNNLIRASAVKLEPIPGNTLASTDSRYNVLVPEVVLIGIPFDDIFEKEEFKLQKLELINPEIEIRRYPSGDKEDSGRERSLAEILSSSLNLLQVDEAQLSGGNLRYIRYGGESPLELYFPQLQAKLTNFSISPSIRRSGQPHKPFYSDNLEVEVKNWQRLLPDSIHWLQAGTLSFSARDSLFKALDVLVYPRADAPAQKDEVRIWAKVPELALTELHYDKLAEDSLIVDQVRIRSPFAEILQPSAQNKQQQQTDSSALAKQIMKLIKADSILLTDGTLVLRKPAKEDTSRLELNNLFVQASGFRYDSLERLNEERILYTDNLVAGLKNYKALLDDGFYEVEAREVGLSTGSSQLWADSIRITPTLERTPFAQKKGYETDQFTFRGQQLLVDQLDLRKLFHEQTFVADKLHLDGFSLYIYRDKRLPFPEDHFPKMPQQLLRNSSWDIMLRETELSNGYLAYAEQVKGASEEGFIDLTNLHVQIDTISNYPALLNSGYTTTLNFRANLMGEGALKAQFEIPFGDTLNRHVFYGSLGGMPLSAFNPILENTSFISVRSGEADQIQFTVVADMESASGTMEFVYDDLRVALVNKRTGKPGGFFRRIGSAVANAFVHSSNTSNGKQEELRKGKIDFERNENRSIVNYWVKTLVNGFKDSIGL